MKRLKFQYAGKCYKQKPEPVLKNESKKFSGTLRYKRIP